MLVLGAIKISFQIKCYLGKRGRVADTLLQYTQQDAKEKLDLRRKNNKILYCLQSFLAQVSSLTIVNFSIFYQILIFGSDMHNGAHDSSASVLAIFQKSAQLKKAVCFQHESYMIDIITALGEKCKNQEDWIKKPS